MANLPVYLHLLLRRRQTPHFLLLLLFFLDGAAAANRPISNHDGVLAGGELWCVAKNNAEDDALQAALDWACGPGSADCRPVQAGGVCFEPEDVQSHASYAFNDYYRRHGSSPAACDFSGTAAVTALDPSHGECRFPASSNAGNGSFSGFSNGSGSSSAGANDSGLRRWLVLYLLWVAATATACNIFR